MIVIEDCSDGALEEVKFVVDTGDFLRLADFSQMALSRASFTTPMGDSNPRNCDRKDFPHNRRSPRSITLPGPGPRQRRRGQPLLRPPRRPLLGKRLLLEPLDLLKC